MQATKPMNETASQFSTKINDICQLLVSIARETTGVLEERDELRGTHETICSVLEKLPQYKAVVDERNELKRQIITMRAEKMGSVQNITLEINDLDKSYAANPVVAIPVAAIPAAIPAAVDAAIPAAVDAAIPAADDMDTGSFDGSDDDSVDCEPAYDSDEDEDLDGLIDIDDSDEEMEMEMDDSDSNDEQYSAIDLNVVNGVILGGPAATIESVEQPNEPIEPNEPIDAAAESAEEDVEEEVEEMDIDGTAYYVSGADSSGNCTIYAIDDDGDIGDEIGILCDGVAEFTE